jgi:hypothetical protein
MMVNYPQEAWHVEKIKESVSEFGKFLVWNRDGSNRARILVKVRVPDLLEVPISLVLCQNTRDEGHGHSWTVVNYILQAKLIGGLGGDEDPLPPDGGNPHPLPNIPFGGIWDDLVHENNEMQDNVAPNHGNVAPGGNAAPAADGEPMVHTPPQASVQSNHNQDIEPAVEAVDALAAYHSMLTDVLSTFPDALGKLGNENVTGARIQMIDVTAEGYSERKCVVIVFTAQQAPANKSSIIISEIYDSQATTSAVLPSQGLTGNDTFDDIPDVAISDAMYVSNNTVMDTPVGKRKNEQAPVDVKEVRRSRKIAVISVGYKDKEAADAAMARELEKEQQNEARKGKDKGKEKEKKKTSAKVDKKNLNSEFDVEIIDRTAPPRPELPIKIVQNIAVDQC